MTAGIVYLVCLVMATVLTMEIPRGGTDCLDTHSPIGNLAGAFLIVAILAGVVGAIGQIRRAP